jgi:hypothetical protein
MIHDYKVDQAFETGLFLQITSGRGARKVNIVITSSVWLVRIVLMAGSGWARLEQEVRH